MIPIHSCDLLKMFSTDPRIPIKFNEKPANYSMAVNSEIRVTMVYCAFCGKKMAGATKSVSRRRGPCQHLPALSRKPKSSVKFRPNEREFWLYGRNSRMVRLFYCPLCGCKLPLHKNDRRFYKKSEAEVTKLVKGFRNITTIGLALEQFGPPDVQHGRTVEYIYPEGRRMRIGHKRALFYDHLAKTVTVVVIEKLDGSVEVKFYPKEKSK